MKREVAPFFCLGHVCESLLACPSVDKERIIQARSRVYQGSPWRTVHWIESITTHIFHKDVRKYLVLPQMCSVLISIVPGQAGSIWMSPSVTLNEQLDLDRHSDLQDSNKEVSMHCGEILAKICEIFLLSQTFGSPLFYHIAWYLIKMHHASW